MKTRIERNPREGAVVHAIIHADVVETSLLSAALFLLRESDYGISLLQRSMDPEGFRLMLDEMMLQLEETVKGMQAAVIKAAESEDANG